MNPVLLDVIERFRKAQDRGVEFVVNALVKQRSVPMPTSWRDWVTTSRIRLLHDIEMIDGVKVYVHGVGIELIFDDLSIDFDWGDAGEPDGFDSWRLWNFIQQNQIGVPCESVSQMGAWLEEAAALGKLTRDQFLYYSPNHRATRKPTSPYPAIITSELTALCPDFTAAWDEERELWTREDGSYTVHGVFAAFSHYIAKRLIHEDPDLRTVFEYIESKLANDIDPDVSNAACTCFLENLMNLVPGTIAPQNLVPLLGPNSRLFCRAWDEFCGVKTEGLW